MPKQVVISDTSCLIALTKIKALFFLKELYSKVFITSEIASEFGEELPKWIIIEEVFDKKHLQILHISLDLGEASAIALAFEKTNTLLILDDLKGRKKAEKLGLRVTGTLGVLFKAKQLGIIKRIHPYLEELKKNDFRISPLVEQEILQLSGEK